MSDALTDIERDKTRGRIADAVDDVIENKFFQRYANGKRWIATNQLPEVLSRLAELADCPSGYFTGSGDTLAYRICKAIFSDLPGCYERYQELKKK